MAEPCGQREIEPAEVRRGVVRDRVGPERRALRAQRSRGAPRHGEHRNEQPEVRSQPREALHRQPSRSPVREHVKGQRIRDRHAAPRRHGSASQFSHHDTPSMRRITPVDPSTLRANGPVEWHRCCVESLRAMASARVPVARATRRVSRRCRSTG